jgi:hypothetical protein
VFLTLIDYFFCFFFKIDFSACPFLMVFLSLLRVLTLMLSSLFYLLLLELFSIGLICFYSYFSWLRSNETFFFFGKLSGLGFAFFFIRYHCLINSGHSVRWAIGYHVFYDVGKPCHLIKNSKPDF